MHVGESLGRVERRRKNVGDEVLAVDDTVITGAADAVVVNRMVGLQSEDGKESDDDEAEGNHQALDGEEAFFMC